MRYDDLLREEKIVYGLSKIQTIPYRHCSTVQSSTLARRFTIHYFQLILGPKCLIPASELSCPMSSSPPCLSRHHRVLAPSSHTCSEEEQNPWDGDEGERYVAQSPKSILGTKGGDVLENEEGQEAGCENASDSLRSNLLRNSDQQRFTWQVNDQVWRSVEHDLALTAPRVGAGSKRSKL